MAANKISLSRLETLLFDACDILRGKNDTLYLKYKSAFDNVIKPRK